MADWLSTVKQNLATQFEEKAMGFDEPEARPIKGSGYLPNSIKFHSALNSRREKVPVTMRPRVINFDAAAMDIEETEQAAKTDQMPFTSVFKNLAKTPVRQDSIFDEQHEEVKHSMFSTHKKARPFRPHYATGKTKNSKKQGGRAQLTELFDQICIDENNGNLGNVCREESDSNPVTPSLTGKKKDLVFHRYMNLDEALFSGKFNNKRNIDLDKGVHVKPLSKNQSASTRC